MNLEEIRQHMSDRDHINPMTTDERKAMIYMALADDVPDLVAEVERLKTQLDSMKSWALSQGQSHHNLAVELRDDEEMLTTHNALSSAYFTLANEIENRLKPDTVILREGSPGSGRYA